jgi:hypothetical protein
MQNTLLSQITNTEGPDRDVTVLCGPTQSRVMQTLSAIETSLKNENVELRDRNATLVAQNEEMKGSQNPQQESEPGVCLLSIGNIGTCLSLVKKFSTRFNKDLVITRMATAVCV